ncbi:hypothetical protein V5P93_006783 [Actinokineospora auranticolor]|nr:hypothetical protein [Actinokineospora auranticolor]
MAGAEASRRDAAFVPRLLPVPAVVAAAALAVLVFLAAGHHPVALFPGVACLVALVAAVWSRPDAPAWLGLGVVALSAVAASTVLLYLAGGHNTSSLLIGALIAALTAGALIVRRPKGPIALDGWLGVAATATAGAVVIAGLVPDAKTGPVVDLLPADPLRHLQFSGLLLLTATGLMVARRAAGPARFALHLLLTAATALLVYLLAITGAGSVVVTLGVAHALVAVAALVAAGRAGSSERAG